MPNEENPSGTTKYPGVRLRNFKKKEDAPAPPPGAPAAPSVKAGPPAVRFRKKVTSAAPEEVGSQPVEVYAEAPVDTPAEYVEPYVEPAPQASAETYVEPIVEPAPPASAEPYVEPIVEPAPVEVVPAAPVLPPAAEAPSVTAKPGVRVRISKKAEPTPEAPAPNVVAQPAAAGYKPDDNPERVLRRQWWKYDLRVKAGRQQEEAKQK